MKKSDLLLIPILRNNSRTKLSEISTQLNIPITTIFDILKRMDCLVRFSIYPNYYKLGFSLHCFIAIKVKIERRNSFIEFIKNSLFANTFFRTNSDADFFVEFIFPSFLSYDLFFKKLSLFGLIKKSYIVITPLKIENMFSSKSDLIEIDFENPLLNPKI